MESYSIILKGKYTLFVWLGFIPGPRTSNGTLISNSYSCRLSIGKENWPINIKSRNSITHNFQEILKQNIYFFRDWFANYYSTLSDLQEIFLISCSSVGLKFRVSKWEFLRSIYDHLSWNKWCPMSLYYFSPQKYHIFSKFSKFISGTL